MSEALMQNALVLRRAGRLAEAADIYARVLQNEPQHFEALHALGILRYQGGQLTEAERLIGEAVKLRPGAADALYNRACLLQKLNRAEEALRSFDAALAVKPGYVEALTNRGTLFMSLKRYEAALADFEKAANLRPALPQVWNNRASALVKLGRSAEALASTDRALAIYPGFADVWRNRGAALLEERRFTEALASFDQAAAIEPNSAGAWTGRGHALSELGRREDAIASYGRALQLAPEDADTLYHRASTYFQARQFEPAAEDCRKLLALDPNYPHARGTLLFANLSNCDWRGFAEDRERAIADLRSGKPSLGPFECIALSESPEDAAIAARLWANDHPPAAEPLWLGESCTHEKIRVAYLSANFHDHAVSRLMAGVWDHHDKTRFETIAISSGPDDGSAMRKRVSCTFDRFVDIRGQSDRDAAMLLRGLEADIAVDLMGYTEGCRPGILRYRPAPVQVNFLGFPGTMGGGPIDYILADRMVIPEAERVHFSEQVMYLPNSYLPNDSRRAIGPALSRAEAGLPEHGFVFATFNASYKFTPAMFGLWMRLLEKLPESMLWIGQVNATAARNLKLEASARRIDPERIVLAPFVRGQEDHLARLSLADLVLDTLPYNSHATACDALWAGVPVLTCAGRSFAGRVAASALTAAGLPELIASSLAEYEALALKVAGEPREFDAIKAKLARQRHTHPLFDTAGFTRDLEAAYTAMYERRVAQSFAIAGEGP
jgi:predicted O-linked N-acetylglucosamine transferase (SPINDLY family)